MHIWHGTTFNIVNIVLGMWASLIFSPSIVIGKIDHFCVPRSLLLTWMKVHAHHMRSIFDTSFLWSRLMRRRLRPSLLGWISFSTKCCTKGTIYTSGGVQRKRVLLSDDVFQICNILKPSYVSAGLIQAYCECGIIEFTTFHCFYLRGIKIWRHPIRIRKGNLGALKLSREEKQISFTPAFTFKVWFV